MKKTTFERAVIAETKKSTAKLSDDLEAAAEDYRRVLDNSLDIICQLDADGKFVKVSHAAQKVWGYEPEELIGTSYWHIVHPDDNLKTTQATNNTMAGKPTSTFENRTLRKDGSIAYMMWSGYWSETHQIMYCVARDVSEIRLAETALERSETNYRNLIESLPAIVYCAEAVAPYASMYISPNVAAFGYEPEEWKGRPDMWISLIHDEDRERVLLEAEAAIQEGPETELEYRMVTHDGQIHWMRDKGQLIFDSEGIVTGWQRVITDVTKRTLAEVESRREQRDIEAKLRNSEERLRAIFEAEPECVKLLGKKCELLDMNPAGLAMIGADSLEQVRGKIMLDVLMPEYRKAFAELNRKVFGGGSGTLEFEIIGLNGEKRWLDTHATPLFNAQGEVEALLGLTRDITEHKKVEAELSKSREHMAFAQKVAKLGSWETDLSTLIVTWSEETYRIFEVDSESFQPTHEGFLEFVHPDDRAAVDKAFIDSFTQYSTCLINHRLLMPNGRIKFIEEQWEILRDADDRPVTAVGTMQDVTRRMLAEAAQQASEERLGLLFLQMKDGFYCSTPEGRLLDINPAMIEMFGYASREEMLKVNVTRDLYFSAEDRKSRTVDAGRDESEVYRMRRKDGSVIWVEDRGEYKYDEEGKVVFHQGLLRDVTDRKMADEKLVRSEEQYRDLVENSREMICTHDLEGRILSVNRAAAEVFGYNPMDDGGVKNLRDILVPEFRDQFADYLTRIRRDGFADGLMFILTSTGQRRIWEYHNTLRTEGVPVPMVRAMARDITDSKRDKNERRVIFEIIQGSITSPSLDEFLKLIHRSISQLVYAENCFVMLHDDATDIISFEFWVDKHDPHPSPKIRGKGYASHVLATGQPLLLTPKAKKELQEQGMAEQIGSDSASWLGVPLRTPDRTIGVLVVQHYDDEKAYNQHDLEFLSSVGDQIALAIERKRAEEILSDLRRELGLMMDTMEEGVHRIDLEGTITFDNPAAARMLGWEASELLGRPGHLTMHHTRPDGTPYPKEECPIYATFHDGASRQVADEVFWRQDGTSFPVEYSTTPMRNDQNEIVGSLVTFRDITERKLAEARIRAFATLAQKLSGAVTRLDAGRIIAEIAKELLTWDACNLDLYDADRDLLHPMLNVDLIDGKTVDVTSRSAYGPPSARDRRVIEFGSELTLREDPIQFDKGAIPFGDTARPSASIMTVPVRNASQVIGLLSIHSYTPRAYDAEALNHLQSLADHCGEAINRIQAEEALEQSEELYRELVENAYDMIYTRDIDGNITSINAAGQKMTGYSLEEFPQLNMREIVVPEHLDRAKEKIAQKLAGIEGTSYEADILLKDGRRLTLEVNTSLMYRDGVAVGVQGIARDISERKLAEESLRHSEQRYRDLVENAHDIIYSHDLEGNYTSMNAAGERITGYSQDEALRLNIAQTVVPEQIAKATQMVADKLNGLEGTAYELDLLSKSGNRINVEVNTKLITHDGLPVGVQGIARDITERKLLEEQLRQSQKLESVGRLAGGIAHDFNNMLTAINGFSELTLRQMTDDDPVRHNLEEIKKAGERAASLTYQLLAFSRKQILHPETVRINDVIIETSNMLERLIGKDVELVTVLKTNVGNIKADPGQLAQIVMNLAVNARDAMPNGGKLTIETRNIFVDPDYAINHVGVLPGAYIMLAVSDNGMGIPAELLDKIFEPFFTTKEMGKGTGLGLATVYGIVKQSGGGIFVYSEIGHGTTFKIFLPRVIDNAEETEKMDDPSVKLALGTETILLVEDEEMVRSLARQILESCGYTVIEACDGVEALEIFEKEEGPIDLIITDAIMPRMGGRELVEKVSAIRPEIPVLFASGYTDDAVVRHGVLEPNFNFIQKPFTLDDLVRKVRDMLDASQGHRSP